MAKSSFRGKYVCIVGGSRGLGKEIAKILAAQGAHVTIFARGESGLDLAKTEILASRLSVSQKIDTVAVDMSNSSMVDSVLRSQPHIADVLYCVAGGCSNEGGFMADINTSDLDVCMRNNYFTAAYAAHAMFKIWTEDDKSSRPGRKDPTLRQIVFINSAVSLIPLPGYAAYTASKCAVRALADTLRMESLHYSNRESTYTIHCAFPSNFITDSFIEEQIKKPELTKRLEGTLGPISSLQNRFPSATKIALIIIDGVKRGDFAICDSSFESNVFWANMVGMSPKRGWGIVDSILGVLGGCFLGPVTRWYFDSLCKEDGK